MGNRVAIIGIGQTHFKSKRPDVNIPEMINEAVRAALADAEMEIKGIEAVFTGNMETFEGVCHPDHWMAVESGAFGRPGMKVGAAGTTGATVVDEAFHMVAAGVCDTALAIGYQKHDQGNATGALTTCCTPVWGAGFAVGAMQEFAKQALTYMERTGAREEHAAMVRLKADYGACRNPYAHLRLGLSSIDEILQSAYLVWPLRILDFCPQSNGACALILASEHVANRLSNKPVWIADMITVHQTQFRAGIYEDLTGRDPYSQEVAAARLYKRNGITDVRRDIDLAEIYEPSNWQEMTTYEHLYFCEKGEGWKMVEKHMTDIEGEFPVNCSGGVIATNAIGATPTVRIAEAALQIRGDAGERQATRDIKTALATALGSTNWTILTLLRRSL